MDTDARSTELRNPFALSQPRYAKNRRFLNDKPGLAATAATAAQYSPASFLRAAASTANRETALAVSPLVYLRKIKAIACRECRHVLSATVGGLMRHLRAHHVPKPLTGDEYQELKQRLEAIVADHGKLTESRAWRIRHGRHFFSSLTLYLDGMACNLEGCGWVQRADTDAYRNGKRHMNRDHGIRLSGGESHRSHFVFGLPLQRVERFRQARSYVYFIPRLPDAAPARPSPAAGPEVEAGKENRRSRKKKEGTGGTKGRTRAD